MFLRLRVSTGNTGPGKEAWRDRRECNARIIKDSHSCDFISPRALLCTVTRPRYAHSLRPFPAWRRAANSTVRFAPLNNQGSNKIPVPCQGSETDSCCEANCPCLRQRWFGLKCRLMCINSFFVGAHAQKERRLLRACESVQ